MLRSTTLFICLTFALLVSGCVIQPIAPETPTASTPSPTAATSEATSEATVEVKEEVTEETTEASVADTSIFSVELLSNLAYTVDFLESGPIQLTDGQYEDAANRVLVRWTDTYALGELNGEPAAAVILATDTGGSGNFRTLAVVQQQEGALVNVASAFLGDRITLNWLALTNDEANDKIVIDLVTQGPDEAMCCGTQRTLVSFALQEGELTETAMEVIGDQPQVETTEVITFTPEAIPEATQAGSCFTNAIGLGRADAWRCTTEDNQIHDPCFQTDDAPTVVCGVDPILGEEGFVLELTEPLPAVDTGELSKPWIVELSDGTICGLLTGTIPGVGDQVAPYGCADEAGSYLMTEFNEEYGVWFAQRVTFDLGDEGFSIRSSVRTSVARVWQ